tara:strand:+ start:1587 stop:2642 length:1056 start_codon:yes stop_codon:yes gene_type:complete
MQIVQIVKRYGTVGGMEEYVFQLSTELIKLGCEVIVLCEKSFSGNTSEVKVYEVGSSAKPRWFSHYQFSQKISNWLAENPSEKRIVHSHERQSSHHISTFHTTPFGHNRMSLFRFTSLRNYFYEQLERRELNGRNVQVIVPVSNRLGEMMLAKHHGIKEKLSDAIYPAVSITNENPTRNPVPPDGGAIGFIGKEWERKGLKKVVQIWRDLKKIRPNLHLKVAGPPKEAIQYLFSSVEKDYELLGYVDDKPKFYESIDLLVHPAKLEAFGMVITEALSFGVPVLCSSECGAAEVISDRYECSALSYHSKNEFWLNELESILSNKKSMGVYTRTWDQVAREYHSVYESIAGRI